MHTHTHTHSPLTHHTLTHVLGVFVVPNKPLGDVDLTRFQVTLEELESQSGTTFHSRLDRSKACMLESHSHTSLTHPMKKCLVTIGHRDTLPNLEGHDS